MHGYRKFDSSKAIELRDKGISVSVIATRLDVSVATVSCFFRKHDATQHSFQINSLEGRTNLEAADQ